MNEDDKIWVELVNFDSTLYAKAVIAENYKESVQKAVDSSRGYGLRLTSDDGRSMWVGMGFHDRNDAFDFYASFEDYEKKRDMKRNPEKYSIKNTKAMDFSLKEGEVLDIDFGLKNNNNSDNGNPFSQNPFENSNHNNFDNNENFE